MKIPIIQKPCKQLSHPRKNWEEAFRQMADDQEDQLLFDDVFDDEYAEEKK